MATPNEIREELRYRHGDDTNVILRKILGMLFILTDTVRSNMIDNPSTTVSVTAVPLTDRSGTITVANTSQQVAAANPDRKIFIFANVSDKPMWINFGVVANIGQPSFLINAGGSMTWEGSTVTSDAVNVISPNAGKAFTAKEG